MSKPSALLREAFAGLGVSELPDWARNFEVALAPPAPAPAPLRQRPEVKITHNTPSPQPFGVWLTEFLGLPAIPEWMRGIPSWCTLYTTRNYDVDKLVSAKAPSAPPDESTKNLPPLPWEMSPKAARQAAKAIARRTAEVWPARRKVCLVRSGKRPVYGRAGDLANRPGAMVVLEIKAPRKYDTDRHKKVACCGEKAKTVRTLAGDVKVVQPDIRPTRYKIPVGRRAKLETILHKDRIGQSTVVIGREFARGHDAHLARQEQNEKLFGFEVSKGCKKPRWMTEERWQEVQAEGLFQYLNTDWSANFGAGNPDLQAKFSGLEL